MAMMRRVLCVDPGATIGWCVLHLHEERPAEVAACIETDNSSETIAGVWESISPDLMVVETWEYRHGVPADARMACEPLGALKLLAWKDGIPTIEQRPGFRVVVPDDRKTLEPLGWWIPGQKSSKEGLQGHARQAMRHGIAYLVHTARHLPTMRHLTG